MAKKTAHPEKTRYEKIKALLKRRVMPAALFSNELVEQHELRTRRHPDSIHFSANVDDVETPEDCWEKAGARIRQIDPKRKRARAAFREMTAVH